MTTEAITSAIDLVESVITNTINLIASNPLFLAYAVIPLVGVGIGLFKRLAN